MYFVNLWFAICCISFVNTSIFGAYINGSIAVASMSVPFNIYSAPVMLLQLQTTFSCMLHSNTEEQNYPSIKQN